MSYFYLFFLRNSAFSIPYFRDLLDFRAIQLAIVFYCLARIYELSCLFE